MTDKETQDLIYLIRMIKLQYKLDNMTEDALFTVNRSLEKARKEITAFLEKKGNKITEWGEKRAGNLLREFDKLTIGARADMMESISVTTGQSYATALSEYNGMLSWDDHVDGFNFTALSPAQLDAVITTPIGGKILNEWVNNTFNGFQEGVKQKILTGMLKGETYRDMVKRFSNITERSAITLARTYVQSANVQAHKLVYRANSDVVKGVKWSSALEPGDKKTGRGTCLRCAALDGKVYPLEKHPSCPLHARCRCVLLPVTKTWKELGLNTDEIEDVKRPYTVRGEITDSGDLKLKNIDAGGKRKIQEVGFHRGDYASWVQDKGDKYLAMVMGPKRLQLLKDGKIAFGDFVDPITGDLRTLEELENTAEIRQSKKYYEKLADTEIKTHKISPEIRELASKKKQAREEFKRIMNEWVEEQKAKKQIFIRQNS